jgi:hypothetical protein
METKTVRYQGNSNQIAFAKGLNVKGFDFFQIVNIWSSATALALFLTCMFVFLLRWKPLRDFLGFEDNEDDDNDDDHGGGMLQSLDLVCGLK